MRLLAKNGENIRIYDSGDDWFIQNDSYKTKDYIPKKEQPLYPLAACLKWGFEPVDTEFLNELSAQA